MSTPALRLRARSSIFALVLFAVARFCRGLGGAVGLADAPARERRRSGSPRCVRRALPRARRHLHQGRADHVDAARSVSAARHSRARDAAGQRRAVPLRRGAAHAHRGASASRPRSCSPRSRRCRSPRRRWRRCTRRGSHDGRVVAVKVRRPKIDELVRLRPAGDAPVRAGAERRCRRLRLLAPVESVEEFGRGIRMQLDFTIEARQQPPLPQELRRRSATCSSPRSSTSCARCGS